MASSGFGESLAEVENDRSQVMRNLKRLQKTDSRVEPNDVFLGKYLALRKLKGANCRITAAMLLEIKSTGIATNTLTQEFWVLPKSRRPTLDTEIERRFFIDPSLLESLPPGFGPDEIWVLDQAILQSEVGPGALRWASGVSSTFSAPLDDKPVALHENGRGPAVETQIPETKEAVETLTSCGLSSQGSSDFSKLLCSDNIQTTSGEDVFEDIAKETKSAMDAQRYYSEHLQDASTIEFWLRAYVAHVAKLYAAHDAAPSSGSGDPTPAFVDTLPEYVKRYVGFVVNCLLSSPCRFVLDKFTVLFDQLSEMCPELIPPMARALEFLTGDILFAYVIVCVSYVMLPHIDH